MEDTSSSGPNRKESLRLVLNLIKNRRKSVRAQEKMIGHCANGILQPVDQALINSQSSDIHRTLSLISSLCDGTQIIEAFANAGRTANSDIENALIKIQTARMALKTTHLDIAFRDELSCRHLKTLDKYRLHVESLKSSHALQVGNQDTAREQRLLLKINVVRSIKAILIGKHFNDENSYPRIQEYRSGFLRDLTFNDFSRTWDVGRRSS